MKISALIFIVLAISLSTVSAQIRVNGGNPILAITAAMPGGSPLPVVDVSTSIRYARQTVTTKMTVATVCAGQDFTLKVLAASVPDGVAAPEVTLSNGMLPLDFITNIPPKPPGGNVTATLRYTASSTWAQGNSAEMGDDIHTVTYTLVAQ